MHERIKTKGIILVRKNIGEADRLLSIFTEDLGKIKVVAKGSRRIKSKMAPHIEPLNIISLQLVEGKTFYILTDAERVGEPHSFTKDMDIYRTASYICELVDLSFQEKEPNKAIFLLLTEAIHILSGLTPDKREQLARYFEMELLISLGYKPDYHLCKKCQEAIKEQPFYHGDFEGCSCDKCSAGDHKISKTTLKALREMKQRNLQEYLAVDLTREVEAELQEIICPYLVDILPRPPKSNEL